VGSPIVGETVRAQETGVEFVHNETASPYGEFEIRVTTADPEATTIEVDPDGFGVRLSSDDPVEIELNRVMLREREDGNSTYTVTVDVIGGADGDIGEIAVWVDSPNRDRDRIALSTVEIKTESTENEREETTNVTGEIEASNETVTEMSDTPRDSTVNESTETDTVANQTPNRNGETETASNPRDRTLIAILGTVGVVSLVGVGLYKTKETGSPSQLLITDVRLTGAGKEDTTDRNSRIMYRIRIRIKNNTVDPVTVSSVQLQTDTETIELFTGNGSDGAPTWNDVTVQTRSELSLKGFGEYQDSLSTIAGEIVVESTAGKLTKQVSISPAMKF